MVRDRVLRGRIGEYLQSRPELSYLDAEDVAQDLMEQFPEYARRKKRDFTAICRLELQSQGVDVLLSGKESAKKKRKAVGSTPVREDSPDSIVLDAHIQSKANNRANSSLRNFYGSVNGNSASPTNSRKRESSNVPGEASMDDQIARKVGRKAARKPSTVEFDVDYPTKTFADVGAYRTQLTEMCQLCVHLKRPEIFTQLRIRPPAGFLLHGPAGCGKSLVAQAIAGELNLPLISVAAPSLVAGVSGESENRIRDLFAQAKQLAPCILLLDEIDVIAGKRDHALREMERRIVAQLLSCLDDLISEREIAANQSSDSSTEDTSSKNYVMVIGITTRLDTIDAALRRAGRFDREIGLGVPSESDRNQILEVMTRDINVADNVDLSTLARLTPGFVGADLDALCREASMNCMRRILHAGMNAAATSASEPTTDELTKVLNLLRSEKSLDFSQSTSDQITHADFVDAMSSVQPSAKREGFATVPDVKWEEVGALHEVREQLKWSILYPIKYRQQFLSFGLSDRAQGILLAGPPGCGKTLLAKAVANQTGMNFISVKGPELLSMYVGESERAVRALFQRARNSVPCVVFFDEIDALCPRRQDGESGGSVRVVNQLLTELDGLEARKQVFVIAATNRPDMLDPALLRPGRLDKTLHVTLPNSTDRRDILNALTSNFSKPRIAADVGVDRLAADEMTNGFSGADLAALVRECSVAALKELISNVESLSEINSSESVRLSSGVENQSLDDMKTQLEPGMVSWRHIELALANVRPSVSARDQAKYDRLMKKDK